jgi:septum formation protein
MRTSIDGPVWAGERPLVLASRSASRLALLRSLGIEAQANPARIDERAIEADMASRGAAPIVVARALATEKARAVSRELRGRIVLGADQVLAFEDRCWPKAENLAEAGARLAMLSGNTHQLISACAVAGDGIAMFECVDMVSLHMRALHPADIKTYLNILAGEALTSVGGYQIEGVGRLLFDSVEGDQATIIGLPLVRLLAYFRAQGLIRL